jgi:hypothetical protein
MSARILVPQFAKFLHSGLLGIKLGAAPPPIDFDYCLKQSDTVPNTR